MKKMLIKKILIKNLSIRQKFIFILIPVIIIILGMLIYLNYSINNKWLKFYMVNEGIKQTDNIASVFNDLASSCQIISRLFTDSIESFNDYDNNDIERMAFKTLSYYTEIYQLRIVVLKSSNGYYEENKIGRAHV